MRRSLVPVASVGFLVLVAGVCWAYGDREVRVSAPATVLLIIGTVLCLGALTAYLGLERRPPGVELPPGIRSPVPHWMAQVALVGLADLCGGLWASLPMAVLGGGLLVLAAVGYAFRVQGERPVVDRATLVAAREIAAFAARHRRLDAAAQVRDSAEATSSGQRVPLLVTLEHVARDGVRIVVVGEDGAYGDQYVRGLDRAEAAARMAGATIVESTERELGASIRIGAYEWNRMAGMQLGGDHAAS